MTAPRITPFSVSVYTSLRPLGKRFTRLADGTIQKASLGSIVEGTVQTERLGRLSDFAARRSRLDPSQALGYGVTGHPRAHVVTKATLAASAGTRHARGGVPLVARDAEHLHFPDGPGLLMLDHDPAPSAAAMEADELREALCQAMPQLCAVSMFWTPSAGSMIYAGNDEVIGLRGSRMYFVVSDARRIPAVGQLLFNRLTMAGHGHIAISGSGTLLRRGPIDSSVWQPERLDYVRATCGPGLEQRPSGSKLFAGDGVDRALGETMLDIDTLQPLTSDEEETLAAVWAKLCTDAKPDGDRARHAWAVARAQADAMRSCAQTDSQAIAARVARYESSARTLELDGHHQLKLADGREITVAELRADAKRFDGVRMADPFEPEYGGNDHRIAMAYLLREGGSDPAIFSHAHGGVWYSLLRPGEVFEQFDDFDSHSPSLGISVVPASEPTPCSGAPALTAIAAAVRARFTVQRAADFRAGPPPRWLIRDVMPQGELVVVYGESGSGKSFVVLDMVACIASGNDWREKSVTQGRVVYVVAEGRSGFRKRLDALHEHGDVDLDTLDLGIVADCPDLLNGDEVALAAAIKAAGGASVVVIDTLSQALAGGDENSSVDMGAALVACKKMHEETGATVLLIHHAGKDRARGSRGWSGLRAAADAELEVVRKGEARHVRISKQKDGGDSDAFHFELKVVDLGMDEDLFPITSCVVHHLQGSQGVEFDGEVLAQPSGKWQRHLCAVLAASSDPVKRDDLVAKAIDLEAAPDDTKRDTRKQKAARALSELLKSGWLSEVGSAGLVLASSVQHRNNLH